jgi:hypothetical protein
MENKVNIKPGTPEEPEHGSAWMNVGRWVFLVVVLVAAWFILEWLTGWK